MTLAVLRLRSPLPICSSLLSVYLDRSSYNNNNNNDINNSNNKISRYLQKEALPVDEKMLVSALFPLLHGLIAGGGKKKRLKCCNKSCYYCY